MNIDISSAKTIVKRQKNHYKAVNEEEKQIKMTGVENNRDSN